MANAIPANKAPNRAGLFSGADEVRGAKSAPDVRLGPGRYLCRVVAVKSGTTNDSGRDWYGADLEIVEAAPSAAFQAGQQVRWSVVKHPKWSYLFLRDAKQFVGAAMGGDSDDVSEDELELSLSDDQPLAGRTVTVLVQQAYDAKAKTFRLKADGSPQYNAVFTSAAAWSRTTPDATAASDDDTVPF